MNLAEKTKEASLDVYGLAKPKLRGMVHVWAIVPFALAGVMLTIASPSTPARLSVAVYSIAITGMLVASACYHRLRVSESVRAVLRRIDHSMIGVAVAGTYTPIIVLVLTGPLRWTLLTLLWVGAFSGLVLALAWPKSPRSVRAGLYVVLGWAGVVVLPWLFEQGGIAPLILVAFGGALYSAGAVVYAKRKPDISPRYFGFHELFHTFVVAAVACHFAAVAVVVSTSA